MTGGRVKRERKATPGWRRLCGLAILVTVCCLGCGRDSLAPVRGTVSYRGAPLQGGTIVFTPDSAKGTRGQIALGEIQTNGSYELRSGETPGTVPGWHRVTVVAVQAPLAALPGGPLPIPQSLLPEKYRDPELSGLVREIKAGQINTIDFELE